MVCTHLVLLANLLLEACGSVSIGPRAGVLLGPVLLLHDVELLGPLGQKHRLDGRSILASVFLVCDLTLPFCSHESIEFFRVEGPCVVTAVAPQRVELILNQLLASSFARVAKRVCALQHLRLAVLHGLLLSQDLRPPKFHLRVVQIGQLRAPVKQLPLQRLLLALQRVLAQTALDLGRGRYLKRSSVRNLFAVVQLHLHQHLLLLHLLAGLHGRLNLPAVQKPRRTHGCGYVMLLLLMLMLVFEPFEN